MSVNAFDASHLTDDPSLIAAVVPKDALFGLLSRAFQVAPGWTGLVVGPEGGLTIVPAGGQIAAGDTEEVLFVRATPLSFTFEARSLTSSDDYLCDASLQMAVAMSDQAADLTAFRSTVLGTGPRGTLSSLHDYLADSVHRGLTDWARTHTAAKLVEGEDAEAFEAAIHQATEAACFSAGLRLTGEVRGRFTSSALESIQVEAERTAVQRDRLTLQRQLREAAAAARREHLEEVEQTLARLQKMTEGSPGVSVGELIRQFGQDQRGPLYRSLTRCSPTSERCASLVVVAGDEVVWLDPDAPERPSHRQRVDLPGGALRSVRLLTEADGERVLAVGGASAVGLLDPASGEVRSQWAWEQQAGRTIRGGINSVGLRGWRLLATHSELGLCMWPLDPSGEGTLLLTDMTRAADAVRHVQTDAQGRVWLSVDDVVVCLAGDDLERAIPTTYAGNIVRITSLVVGGDAVFAGNENGQVLRWPIDRPNGCEVVYSGGAAPCRSVHAASVMGIDRLGLTDDSDAVKELMLGDTVVERYVADGDRLRQAWWLGDRIVAVNDRRSCLYVWRIGHPDAPTGTADVGWMCSNRVQDVCMIPAEDPS